MRTGHGYDAHRFADTLLPGKPLVLGGVTIPHERSLLAHSDGDAVVHALCDALLGAIGRGDIGRHFPDTDAAFSNIDSMKLLTQVCAFLHEENWKIGNVDITILAQAPKMAPHIPAMCQRLAQGMGILPEQVNVKASTTEGMGFVGRREGIETYAVVLIYRDDDTA
ncbi:MAG: 2-C-methyl-D-erythritol 2,4-cyclodiphosphate synthase [Pseudomonadales bacterium]|nr:2-C-methyl-D-erythritol 2,4-cyclodiphosphate synthase [Pseudomonadales bacterium]MCP5358067.1 2-C-methyl-D-erythritol 2,4-cyclodiphosphate synthase [Pseudomonadales bacterium]